VGMEGNEERFVKQVHAPLCGEFSETAMKDGNRGKGRGKKEAQDQEIIFVAWRIFGGARGGGEGPEKKKKIFLGANGL